MNTSQTKAAPFGAVSRQWRVRGYGRNGYCVLTITADDHNAAVRAASRRFVRVMDCVLIESSSKETSNG